MPSGKRHCGECLMNDVEIVELKEDGKCPRCGAEYGKETDEATIRVRTTEAKQGTRSGRRTTKTRS